MGVTGATWEGLVLMQTIRRLGVTALLLLLLGACPFVAWLPHAQCCRSGPEDLLLIFVTLGWVAAGIVFLVAWISAIVRCLSGKTWLWLAVVTLLGPVGLLLYCGVGPEDPETTPHSRGTDPAAPL